MLGPMICIVRMSNVQTQKHIASHAPLMLLSERERVRKINYSYIYCTKTSLQERDRLARRRARSFSSAVVENYHRNIQEGPTQFVILVGHCGSRVRSRLLPKSL